LDIAFFMTSLLPRDQFASVSAAYGPGPFTREFKNERQVLFYFGANHSRNPADPQYSMLREYWAQFLAATEGKERIVLIEGGLRPVPENEEIAITSGSEGSLVTFLAHQANISVACPDISDEELIRQQPKTSKEEILLYWFLSYVGNYQRQADPKPDFEKSVRRWCENQQQRKIWEGMEISLSVLKELYAKVLGREFDENEDPNDLVNPNKTETPVNRVARTQSDLRDANIVSEIERYWNEGKSIFVAFGSGHLIIEEPALKELLK
jgi:hypothetical protein